MANAASKWLETGLDYANKAMGVVAPFLGWFGSSSTNAANLEMMREQNEFNAEQAQMQRDWSANEAGKQRGFEADQALLAREYATNERLAMQDWQEAMIEQQNEYNSPVNQVARMVDAGISPLSLTGVESSASPTGVPSGSLGSLPSSGIPSGASASSSGIIPSVDPFLSVVQAKLLDAQANKTIADTNSERIRQKYLDELYSGQIKMNNVNINLGQATTGLRENEAIRALKECEQIDAYMGQIQASITKLRQETAVLSQEEISKRFENENAVALLAKKLELMDSEIRKNGANIALFSSQASSYQELAKLYLQQVKNAVIEGGSLAVRFDVDRSTKKAKINLQKINTGQAGFDFLYDTNFRETNKWLQVGSDFVGSMSQVLSMFALVKGMNKVPKAAPQKYINVNGSPEVPLIGR